MIDSFLLVDCRFGIYNLIICIQLSIIIFYNISFLPQFLSRTLKSSLASSTTRANKHHSITAVNSYLKSLRLCVHKRATRTQANDRQCDWRSRQNLPLVTDSWYARVPASFHIYKIILNDFMKYITTIYLSDINTLLK